ncbi:GNAT family N-acetyltransferase [Frigidibacter sp. RF13]|uniref:GNAT family N-acetyltransferase n=1 Tax=Frigidibacter sp. RF13 TaxID=2997340 RepID=UPI002271FF0D|nr:GNAT family N-acetyltransferase [Frigidibacter sp. RF13]MCY1127151.1 GNAT family N-acetyltransferase [Frigidibacter sp. RF13]
MLIRPLHPVTDRALVERFFHEAADYIWLERDAEPDAEVTDEYFTAHPPGIDPTTSYRAGLFDGDPLAGLADLAFGYPEPSDAFLGLMMFTPAARGRGLGRAFLHHLETEARRRGAKNIYIAVLEANPRGRAFWEREGFRLSLANRPITLGTKTQIAHRMGKAL